MTGHSDHLSNQSPGDVADPLSVSLVPHIEYAIVFADFDTVCPMAQTLFGFARGRSRPQELTVGQRLQLTKLKAKSLSFIGEKDMRILAPTGHPSMTVLKTDGNRAVLRSLSALMPTVLFAEFESLFEHEKRQLHGLYLRRAGNLVRRAEASVGIETTGWRWDEEGIAETWERRDTYEQSAISKRQTRATLLKQMAALGFDALSFVQGTGVQQIARFRV